MGFFALHAVVVMAKFECCLVEPRVQGEIGLQTGGIQEDGGELFCSNRPCSYIPGSSTFEWPRFCSGWGVVEELTDMIVKHDMRLFIGDQWQISQETMEDREH